MRITINLLPNKKKEEQKNLRIVGATLKVGATLLLAIVVFLVFLEFCILAISIQQKVLESEMNRFEQTGAAMKAKTAQDSLRDYDEKAKKVRKDLNSRKNHWEIISQVNQIMPDKIYLKTLAIKEGTVTIIGTAADREAFLLFEERIKADDIFGKIESPISNFVSEKNAEFEIKAKIKDEEAQEENS